MGRLTLFSVLLFSLPVHAEVITRLSFELCNGVTCSKYRLDGEATQFKSCVVQGPLIISKWMEENGKREWLLKRWSCTVGPEFRNV